MSGISVAQSPDRLETLLGSCVGIFLWCPQTKFGGLAHAMLGESKGNSKQPGRFVDTAIPHIISELERKGATRSRLIAKLCGGSNMFKTTRPSQEVGCRNVETAKLTLAKHKIRLAAEHTGGDTGRVIYISLENAQIDVKIGLDIVARI